MLLVIAFVVLVVQFLQGRRLSVHSRGNAWQQKALLEGSDMTKKAIFVSLPCSPTTASPKSTWAWPAGFELLRLDDQGADERRRSRRHGCQLGQCGRVVSIH